MICRYILMNILYFCLIESSYIWPMYIKVFFLSNLFFNFSVSSKSQLHNMSMKSVTTELFRRVSDFISFHVKPAVSMLILFILSIIFFPHHSHCIKKFISFYFIVYDYSLVEFFNSWKANRWMRCLNRWILI